MLQFVIIPKYCFIKISRLFSSKLKFFSIFKLPKIFAFFQEIFWDFSAYMIQNTISEFLIFYLVFSLSSSQECGIFSQIFRNISGKCSVELFIIKISKFLIFRSSWKCKNHDIEILGLRFWGIFRHLWLGLEPVSIFQKYLIQNRIEIYIFARIFHHDIILKNSEWHFCVFKKIWQFIQLNPDLSKLWAFVKFSCQSLGGSESALESNNRLIFPKICSNC